MSRTGQDIVSDLLRAIEAMRVAGDRWQADDEGFAGIEHLVAYEDACDEVLDAYRALLQLGGVVRVTHEPLPDACQPRRATP